MTNWRQLPKSLWFTITISIVLCFGVLFVGLYVLVLTTGQKAFTQALTRAPIVLPDGSVVFRQVEEAPNNERRTIPLNPLQRKFVEDFRTSLILIGILGLATAVILGYLLSQFFTDPLRRVTLGMKQLRQHTYKLRLDETGTPEIDAVIREYNSLTQKLHEAEQLRKNLISDTAHELNTPLTGLRAQLEGVHDGVLKMDHKRVTSLITQVDRLQGLVSALQEYAQLRGAQYKLQAKRILLADLVNEVLKTNQSELTKAGVATEITIPKDLALKAYPVLLERVFTNLIQNTLRYAQATTLTITADEHTITFSDNGVGIPRKHWPLIFERFYRVDQSRNRQTGGLGLGLAMVKEIVEAHGWDITVQKPSTEKGISFSIHVQ